VAGEGKGETEMQPHGRSPSLWSPFARVETRQGADKALRPPFDAHNRSRDVRSPWNFF
jgi:hypothetical protein